MGPYLHGVFPVSCRKNGEYFWNNGQFYSILYFSLKVVENYFKAANIFTIKAAVSFPSHHTITLV